MTLTPIRLIAYWLWLAVLVLHAPAAFWLGWPVLISFHAWLVVPWLVVIAVRQWQSVAAADAPQPERRTTEAYGD